MRKILALALALTIVLSLCACTANPTNTNEPQKETTVNNVQDTQAEETEPEIGGDLLVWLEHDAYAQALIEAFSKKYPNVNVQYEKVDAINATSKLSLDGPAGIGADVLWCGHDSLAVQDGHIEPLPAELQAKIEATVNEAAVRTATQDGKLYFVPFELDNLALYYNKDLVQNPPETYEEIFEFAKTFNDPQNGKYALRLFPNYVYDNYIYLTAFGYQIFGENGDDWKNPGFDSEEVAEGLAFYKSMREIYDVSTADSTHDAVIGAFNRGEVPFVVYGPWGLADAKASGVNFGTAKIPTINGVQPYSFSSAQMVCVSSYSQNFDAAFAFVEFMASEEGARILYETRGTLTALKDISGVPGLSEDEHLKGFSEQAAYTYAIPEVVEMNYAWSPMMSLLEFVWDDKLTIEEAQAKAMEDYELLLNGSGQSMYD